MKNIIIITSMLLLFTGNNYPQSFSITEELPSERFKNEMGIAIETYPSIVDFPISLMANGEPWRPDPEDGDESGLGVNQDLGLGNKITVLLLFVCIYVAFTVKRELKKNKKRIA